MLSYVLELLFSTSPNDDDSLDENLDKYLDFLTASASLTVKARATAEAMTMAIGMQRIVVSNLPICLLFIMAVSFGRQLPAQSHRRLLYESTYDTTYF